MKCQQCDSERVLYISGKTKDLCFVRDTTTSKTRDGYVPNSIGIGGGDYIEFNFCLDCGQIQGTFPVAGALKEEE